MKRKYNIAVREAADKHGLYMYQIAQIMGVSEPTMMRKMRFEWSEEEQKRVIKLIEEYVEGGK